MESDNGSKTCVEIRIMPQKMRKSLIIENIDRQLVYFYFYKAFLAKLLEEKRVGGAEKEGNVTYHYR